VSESQVRDWFTLTARPLFTIISVFIFRDFQPGRVSA
jgi:hypothetical protein